MTQPQPNTLTASEIFSRVFKCVKDNPPHNNCKVCDELFIPVSSHGKIVEETKKEDLENTQRLTRLLGKEIEELKQINQERRDLIIEQENKILDYKDIITSRIKEVKEEIQFLRSPESGDTSSYDIPILEGILSELKTLAGVMEWKK